MIPVIIESPWRALSLERQAANAVFLDECIYDSLLRGEAPYASHKLYTTALNDNNPTERALGMDAGAIWMRHAKLVAVYLDRGISDGMIAGVATAIRAGLPVQVRWLDGDEPDEMLSEKERVAVSYLMTISKH